MSIMTKAPNLWSRDGETAISNNTKKSIKTLQGIQEIVQGNAMN